MSSPAKIVANQTNALSSTGPRTPEGRNASSQNAITHGLTGGFRVLPQEDQKEFDSLAAGYQNEFRPQGQDQVFLVQRMVESRWEIQRCNRLLTQVVARMSEQAGKAPNSADAVIADALIARTANAYTTLKRYAAAAERSYLRCRRELLEARKQIEKQRQDRIFAALTRGIDRAFDPPVPQRAAAATATVRNEPTEPAEQATSTAKKRGGVPFTDKDPLSWRL